MTTEAPERSTSKLGRYLKTKREAAELTQDELAERVAFTQPAVSAWELGVRVPSAKAVAALARALPDASTDEMLALIEGIS